ncbi:MAG TPA: hypothetical protein VJW23_11495 [Propionibacteriaceae bacterium]|nr:hypothetical protein [Propionibacteriaceae bacterium]
MTKLLIPAQPFRADREGHPVILRDGPLDGQTGEHLGALPPYLALTIGQYGTWTYLLTSETTAVTDYAPGSTKERTREGRVYAWNGRDPNGNRI